MIIETLDLSSI